MTRLTDMTGWEFGQLVVVARGEQPKGHMQAYWLCRCECGNTVTVNGSSLRRGRTRSCGCGRIKHGCANRIPEYHVWEGMKARCLNPNHPHFDYWGGRGISICQRWIDSFEAFYADMGPRPSDRHSIDRIDNDGHYELANCRWATAREQQRNTRRSRRSVTSDV